MHDGKILYALVDTTCILKLTGSIVFNIGVGFDRFISKIISDKKIESFIIDLTETDYIDSTNLGILAKLHESCQQNSRPQPTVISTRENINEVLYNVGFAQIFTIINDLNFLPENLYEVPSVTAAQDALAHLMLNAHRQLMKLNETNRTVFRDVVSFLEQDLLENPHTSCE